MSTLDRLLARLRERWMHTSEVTFGANYHVVRWADVESILAAELPPPDAERERLAAWCDAKADAKVGGEGHAEYVESAESSVMLRAIARLLREPEGVNARLAHVKREEFAWLIEIPREQGAPYMGAAVPRWWSGDARIPWVADVYEAVRFCRREDANEVIGGRDMESYTWKGLTPFATEHGFVPLHPTETPRGGERAEIAAWLEHHADWLDGEGYATMAIRSRRAAAAIVRESEAPTGIERAAEAQHDIWSSWMRWFFDNDTLENRERWKRQMQTPYADLTEDEKESDRKIVRECWPAKGDADGR